MPTEHRTEAISIDQARERAATHAFSTRSAAPAPGRVGLEGELFPIRMDAHGRPAGRVQLEGPGGVMDTLDRLARHEPSLGPRQGPEAGPWEYLLSGGGRLTFEPGGQIEYSSDPHPSVAAGLADDRRVIELLRGAFEPRQAVLAAVGVDVWHPVAEVPQQLRAGRYTSMAAYYDTRGPWGRVMMRNTASLQLNLDLGPEGVWQQRWLLANLMSPFLVATFACSPGDGLVARRSKAWQHLDPTRSGFPRLLVEGPGDDPRAEWAEAALEADVLLVRSEDGGWLPGLMGWSFGDWIAEGHPSYGWPTLSDLDYHLTTLFFEVRPRGFLELRSGEALPDHLRPAPVVLTTALVYDERACTEALGLLEPYRTRLPELWRRAAVHGVRDAEIGTVARRLWRVALEGCERLPSGFLGNDALAATRSFLEEYTHRDRMPADELQRLQAEDPAHALAWACGAHPR